MTQTHVAPDPTLNFILNRPHNTSYDVTALTGSKVIILKNPIEVFSQRVGQIQVRHLVNTNGNMRRMKEKYVRRL